MSRDSGIEDLHGLRPSTIDKLVYDETLELTLEEKEIDALDHELFEPLDAFDDDMKELLIDCVNEKVRRILTLDPSKFKDGRLPFGLRPETLGLDSSGRIRELMEEIERLKDLLEAAHRERDNALRRLEAQLEIRPVSRTPVDFAPELLPPAVEKRRIGIDDIDPDLLAAYVAEQLKAERLRIAELERLSQELQERILALEAELLAQQNLPQKTVVVGGATFKKEKADALPVTDRGPCPNCGLLLKQIKQLQLDVEAAGKGGSESEELREALRVARQSQELLRKLLSRLAVSLRVPASTSGQEAVESVLGKDQLLGGPGTLPGAGLQSYSDALPGFGVWIGEAMGGLDAFEKRIQHLERMANGEPVPEEDSPELLALRSKCKQQQDEIARLLLMIEELRRRVGDIPAAAEEEPSPEVREAVGRIVSKVGLRDVIEAGTTVRLKGVFERLYDDAMQRIQRLDLIRDRMTLASQAYAIASGEALDHSAAIPDLDQVSDEAAVALRGMWYHTEYLFRHACEYAMSQGVEAYAVLGARPSLTELVETTKLGDRGPPAGARGPAAERFQENRQRAGHRGLRRAPRWPNFSDGRALLRQFQSGPLGPGAGQAASRAARDIPSQEEPGAFAAYVAALKEAGGNPRRDEWAAGQRRKPSYPRLDTLLKDSLAPSHSLPALPKGRNVFQACDSDGSIDALGSNT